MKRPPDLPTVRAMWWSLTAMVRVRRALRRRGLEAIAVPPPPALPGQAFRGVRLVLRTRPSTCLERAFVLQAWYAAQGAPKAVVIGIAGPSKDFRAHAWLDGERAAEAEYQELLRLPPG